MLSILYISSFSIVIIFILNSKSDNCNFPAFIRTCQFSVFSLSLSLSLSLSFSTATPPSASPSPLLSELISSLICYPVISSCLVLSVVHSSVLSTHRVCQILLGFLGAAVWKLSKGNRGNHKFTWFVSCLLGNNVFNYLMSNSLMTFLFILSNYKMGRKVHLASVTPSWP
jgi:hypothetical protein